MKSLSIFLCFFCLITTTKSQDSTALQFSNSIKIEQLKSHLETLAADKYKGRGSGEQGQKMAAKYISNHFQNIGLQPFNQKDATYFQSFYFSRKEDNMTRFEHSITAFNNRKIREKDYYFENNFEFFYEDVNLIWIGLGFDYTNLDVKDKIVMVWLDTLSDDLLEKYNIKNTQTSEINSFEQRRQLAKAKGAKGIFFVHPNEEHFHLHQSRHKMMLRMKQKVSSEIMKLDGFPTIYCTQKVARKLFQLSKKKFNAFLLNPTALETVAFLNFKSSFNRNKTENVIGILPGTTKKNEYIFVTAHYDHLGIKDGRIYNGADDNGSGTAALLAMAKTFTAAQKAGFSPERNIVFVAFSGEELGLLGSEFLTNNLTIPHSAIHAVYNIDMIGRASKKQPKAPKLYIVGEKKCTDINAAITEKYFSNIKLDYEYNSKSHSEKLYYRSDHYNFARFGVDFIYYTTGLHENYHLPSDDSDKINYESLEIITQLVFMNIWNGSFD